MDIDGGPGQDFPIEALGDAAAADSALMDASGKIVWAGKNFASRCGQPSGRLVGKTLREALSGLGAPVEPDALEVVEQSGTGVPLPPLGFQSRGGPPRWLQPVLRSVSERGDAAGYRALGLVPVDPVMHRLAQAERARDEVEARLNYDTDTGLPNARMLSRLLEKALRRQGKRSDVIALLLTRIDNAREMADCCGSSLVAVAMRDLAARMVAHLPRGATAARTGEGEVAIVVRSVADTKKAAEMASGLISRLDISVPEWNDAYPLPISIGVATSDGAIDAEALLKNARIALNFHDPANRLPVRVFDDTMRTRLEARSRTRSELGTAIDADQIEPFFQPQIRLSDNEVIGFEVLVRWRHPRNGVIGPPDFLEIAEESGLLPAIDDLVMKKAIAALAALRKAGHQAPRISLNCTGETLRDPNFVDRLMLELDRHDLGPDDIGVEILESVAFANEEDPAFATISALKQKGIMVGIDDFGRGQASILHLVTFNADVVKLDRSLIRNVCTSETSRTVVEATVALAERLGMQTLAEGAETDEQIAYLGELGCHYVQGFGVAHPMPLNDVSRWLSTWRAEAATARAESAG